MTSAGASVRPDRHNGQPTSLCRHQRCIFCRSASWWRVQAPRTLPRRQPSTPPAASPRRAAAPGLQPRRNIPNTRRRLRRRPASAAPLPPLPPVPPRRCPPTHPISTRGTGVLRARQPKGGAFRPLLVRPWSWSYKSFSTSSACPTERLDLASNPASRHQVLTCITTLEWCPWPPRTIVKVQRTRPPTALRSV